MARRDLKLEISGLKQRWPRALYGLPRGYSVPTRAVSMAIILPILLPINKKQTPCTKAFDARREIKGE